jgi:hypothetical protein
MKRKKEEPENEPGRGGDFLPSFVLPAQRHCVSARDKHFVRICRCDTIDKGYSRRDAEARRKDENEEGRALE